MGFCNFVKSVILSEAKDPYSRYAFSSGKGSFASLRMTFETATLGSLRLPNYTIDQIFSLSPPAYAVFCILHNDTGGGQFAAQRI
jgi:hypothetical protein